MKSDNLQDEAEAIIYMIILQMAGVFNASWSFWF